MAGDGRAGTRKNRAGSGRLAAAGLLAGAWLLSRALREDYRLAGRVVLITGGSRGLGLVLAREAAAQGARVAICARDDDTLERARASLAGAGAEIVAVSCDLANRDSVRAAVGLVADRLGPVDVLVNNAGIIQVGPAGTMALADYQEAMAINFWGLVHATLEVLPAMLARRQGRIVNVTSIGGRIAVPHLLPYSASKFAAVGFSQGLRTELAGTGVKVVTVVPGLMRTGSPRHATFRGRHQAEYAWFSIADSLPGLSLDAETAARRILEGARRGQAEVYTQVWARAAAAANALAPGVTAGVLAGAARLLPGAPDEPTGRRKGRESQSRLSPSWLTRLGDRAARRNNELPTISEGVRR